MAFFIQTVNKKDILTFKNFVKNRKLVAKLKNNIKYKNYVKYSNH